MWNLFQDMELRLIDTYIEYDKHQQKNIIHLFGITNTGVSVHCIVDNFEFKFLVELPYENILPSYIEECIMFNNIHINDSNDINYCSYGDKYDRDITRKYAYNNTDMRRNNVKRISNKSIGTLDASTSTSNITTTKSYISMFGYNTDDLQNYLYEVTVLDAKYMSFTASTIIQRLQDNYNIVAKIYDADFDPIIIFSTASKLKGCCWIKLQMGTFSVVQRMATKSEVTVRIHDWKTIKGLCERDDIAPFKVLSFDIECANRKGTFPVPDMDPVIQIGIVGGYIGTDCNIKYTKRCLLTLNTCSDIDGVNIIEFPYGSKTNDDGGVVITTRDEAEKSLLERFTDIWDEFDPDIITGYNIRNFDLPYLLDRGKQLGCRNEFFVLGRIPNKKSEHVKTCQNSKIKFIRSQKIDMIGRVCFDMIDVIRNEFDYGSYKLDNVCKILIGDRKDDVEHTEITALFEGNNEDRKRLGKYCMKDTELVVTLNNKLMSAIKYIEFSRIYGVSMSFLLNRGQQIKVKSMLYRYIKNKREQCYIIPFNVNNNNIPRKREYVNTSETKNPSAKKYKSDYDNDDDNGDDGKINYYYNCYNDNDKDDENNDDNDVYGKKKQQKFKGATVMEPVKGFHNKYPVICLDFTSLYPSIFMAKNICYSTLLPNDDGNDKDDNITVNVSPTSALFVTPDIRKGIIPEILEYLIEARKMTKKQLERETDPFKKKILHNKQLALKTSANSIYGFTGDPTSSLRCLEISTSITAYGREMLKMTKQYIEEKYSATVIYGDTDSVMFTLPPALLKCDDCDDDDDDVTTNVNKKETMIRISMRMGKLIAKEVTEALFESPISLEFEKVIFPMVLCSKKRYCGTVYVSIGGDDDKWKTEMVIKGLQAVRRDSCNYIRQTQKEFISKLMTAKYETVIEYVKSRIDALRNGLISIEELVISKLLRDNYKNPQEHSEVWKKMKARNDPKTPQIGDRVPFVYIANGAKKACDKAEDPVYAERNNLPIDYEKYLERLKSCILQVLTDSRLENLFVINK